MRLPAIADIATSLNISGMKLSASARTVRAAPATTSSGTLTQANSRAHGIAHNPMPDDKKIQAVMYGPPVLAGRFDAVSDEELYSGPEPKPTLRIKVPDIVADPEKVDWIQVVSKEPLTPQSVGQIQAMTLIPLYNIIRERYTRVRESRWEEHWARPHEISTYSPTKSADASRRRQPDRKPTW